MFLIVSNYRRADVSRSANVRICPWHQSVRNDVCTTHHRLPLRSVLFQKYWSVPHKKIILCCVAFTKLENPCLKVNRLISLMFLLTAYNKNRYTGLTVQSTTSAYKVDYSQSHAYPDNKPVYNRYHTHSYTEPYYNRRSRVARTRRSTAENPPFPWYKVIELARSLHWIN